MSLVSKTILVTFGLAIIALAATMGFFNVPEISFPMSFLFFLAAGAFCFMVAKVRGWL